MAYTGDQLYGKQFGDTVSLVAQQKTSLFRSKVDIQTVTNAEDAYFHQIAELELPTANNDRHGDTPSREATLLRRAVTPYPWEDGYLLDEKDVARMVADPQSPIIRSCASSFGRKIDDLVIAAAFADVTIGKTGGSSVAFEDESIGINGTSGGVKSTLGSLAAVATPVTMELAKILTMSEIFMDANVPETDRKYWVISPKDHRAMLAIEEIASSDYVNGHPLVAGSVGHFMGFDFFVSTRLTKDAASSTAYRTFAWSEGGLGLCFIKDFLTRISERADKKYSTGIYCNMDLGAVRIEGARVHECLTVV